MFKIGIDLDNTIINYLESFKYYSKNKLNIDCNNLNSKEEIKQKIKKELSNYEWTKLQNIVYSNLSKAKIFEDFKKFLFLCYINKYHVYIISHKTERSQFNKKIFLRDISHKFINKKLKLFNKRLILKKNIFFCETVNEKIKKINDLNLDYFIDDLKKIIKHPKLDKKINKILFISGNKKYNFNEWAKIESIFFKKLPEDYFQKIISFRYKYKNIIQIKSGKNNYVYKVNLINSSESIIFKFFKGPDSNNNYLREKYAYKKLKNLKFIPKLLGFNDDFHFLIIEHIDGKVINNPKEINYKHLTNYLIILKKIFLNNKNYPVNAKENLSSYCNLKKELNHRFREIKKDILEDYGYLSDIFKMHLENLNFFDISIPNFEKKISLNNDTLNHSDFAFNNAIYKNNITYFFDFEYFGKDNSLKVVSDFFWHPKLNMSDKFKNKYYKILIKKFEIKDNNIFKLIFYAYGIKWLFIISKLFTNSYSREYKNKYKLKENEIKKEKIERIKYLKFHHYKLIDLYDKIKIK